MTEEEKIDIIRMLIDAEIDEEEDRLFVNKSYIKDLKECMKYLDDLEDSL